MVVLCYRSGETIASFVDPLAKSLDEHDKNWELVLVGNYVENSEDNTPAVVREIAERDDRIRAVTKVKEGMMGWDMRAGLEAARGKILAVIDGDGQMPWEDIVRGYKILREGNWDMVKTYREERGDGLWRKLISNVFNGLFTVLFPGSQCRDVNSKPKFMTREVYERMDLRSDDWFVDAEIMIQARRLKCKIGDFPVVFHQIDSRPSFVKPRAILEFIVNLLRYRLGEFRFWFKPAP